MTPDGAKNIEELAVGDAVLARDEHNLEADVIPRCVEETFRNRAEIIELVLGGETIRTTLEHPFFVRGIGWTPTSKLRDGDRLATPDGWQTLKHVEATSELEEVYNIRVAEDHPYFVGRPDWGFSIGAHNRCGGEVPVFEADRPFHFFIRDNATSAALFMGRIDDPTQAGNALTPRVQKEESSRLPGDTDVDQDVDFADFVVFAANFGKEREPVFSEGDFNGDGGITCCCSARISHAHDLGSHVDRVRSYRMTTMRRSGEVRAARVCRSTSHTAIRCRRVGQ